MRWDGSYEAVSLLGSEFDFKSPKIFIFLYFGLLLLLISLEHKYLGSKGAESDIMEAVGDCKEGR